MQPDSSCKISYVLHYLDLWGSCIDVIIGHIRLLCSVIHATNKDACMREWGQVGAKPPAQHTQY